MLALALALSMATHVADPIADDPSPVIGGTDAQTCAWPTAGTISVGVLFGVNCAAAVIHPQLIVTFDECMGGFLDPLVLGENVDAGPIQELPFVSTVDYEACAAVASPGMYACVLAEPALDLPRTPPLAGCETGILEIGREVVIVGFGASADDVSDEGIKRFTTAKIIGASDTQFLVDPDDDATTCGNMDLGGPVYVELPDGSWRIAGIVTTTVDCEGNVAVKRIDRYLPAIEQLTDVTPCHDADGNWAPTEECGAFSLAGPQGEGTWDDLCADTPRSGPSTTCGPAFGDDAAPSVRIATPLAETVIEPDVPIAIDIAVNFAVEDVTLHVDGLPVGADTRWPYGFASVAFPPGSYTLTAIAHGEDGTTLTSEAVVIHAGDPPPAPSTTGDDDDETGDEPPVADTGEDTRGGTSGELPDDTTTDAVADAETDEASSGGCQCAADPTGRSPWLAWAMLLFGVVIGRIRRRRGASRIGIAHVSG